MAYTYRGAPDKCGTNRGYRQHLKDGEPACTRCLIAHRTDTKERRQAQPGYRTYRKAKCGTAGGALSHYRKGEKPCPRCKDALNTYRRAYRAKKKFAAQFESAYDAAMQAHPDNATEGPFRRKELAREVELAAIHHAAEHGTLLKEAS